MGKRLSAQTRPKAAPPKPSVPKRTGPTPAGDNSRAQEEAERVQLISIVGKLSDAEDAIELAKEPLKAAQAARKKIIGLGKAAGFTAKLLERRLEEMKMGSREMAAVEATERRHRRWLGIIDEDQAKLMLGDAAPMEHKDEAHWRGEGLKAGLRNLAATAPPGCPERFVQAFLQERERGLDLAKAANAQAWPDAVDGRPKATVGEQAAADFEADNPEVDVDEAARRLRSDPAFMDRSAPDDAGAAPEHVDEPFEATAEELEGQSPRRAIHEAQEGLTSGEDAAQDEEVV
jgi:hypothetical protein